MEEALAAQEAARRALAGEREPQPAPPAAAESAGSEAQTAEEPAAGPAPQEKEAPEHPSASSGSERPHVGLAEVTDLPGVRQCVLLYVLAYMCCSSSVPARSCTNGHRMLSCHLVVLAVNGLQAYLIAGHDGKDPRASCRVLAKYSSLRCESQNTQQAMSILNYMVNKEASVNPTLLEGVTQGTLHDHVGAHRTATFTAQLHLQIDALSCTHKDV